MYSYEPTSTPTKSPWSETAFVTFLYGDNTNVEGDAEGSSQSSGENGNQEQINDALENFGSLQFHFFCGYSWSHGGCLSCRLIQYLFVVIF